MTTVMVCPAILFWFYSRIGNTTCGSERIEESIGFAPCPVVTFSKREGLSRDTAGSVFASKDGSVWVGTGAGLNRVRNRSVTVYSNRDGLPSNGIQAILEDHSGGLWVGTTAGLAYSRNSRFHSVDLPNGAKIRSLAAGAEESDGILWFSDVELGLIQLQDGHIERIVPWSLFENKQAYAL